MILQRIGHIVIERHDNGQTITRDLRSTRYLQDLQGRVKGAVDLLNNGSHVVIDCEKIEDVTQQFCN